MCLLIVELLLLAGGLYALIVGRVKLTKNLYLEGWRARIAGLFLVAPLPLAFATGILIGVLLGAGILPASAEQYLICIDPLLVLGALAGAVIFALLTKSKAPATTEEGQAGPPAQV